MQVKSNVQHISRDAVNTIKRNLAHGQWAYVAQRQIDTRGLFLRITDIRLSRAGTPTAKFLRDGRWYAIDAVHISHPAESLSALQAEMEAGRCTECSCTNGKHYEGCRTRMSSEYNTDRN
jgi:hypothetical protein